MNLDMKQFENAILEIIKKDSQNTKGLLETKNEYLKYHNAVQAQLDEYLINSCIFQKFENIKYLLTSPLLETHANIHADNDTAFEYLLDNNSMDIIHYLIFEYNIEKTSKISDLLIAWPSDTAKEVDGLFSIRDLNQSLNNELVGNNKEVKKAKI